jgi:hypothetical protein
MDIRGLDRPSNAPCCLDLLRRYLRFFLRLRIGLDTRPHPRIAGCRSDDLFMAVGSGSGPICDLPSVRPSTVIDLHRRVRWHHRNRNDLVVACSEEQVLKWTIGAGDPADQLMRIQIESHSNLRASPRSLYRAERRIDIIEIVDQWYGPGYRYVKVRGHDKSVYILRFDEICDHWELIMFCAAPAQGWQRKHHDLARSAQSRQ